MLEIYNKEYRIKIVVENDKILGTLGALSKPDNGKVKKKFSKGNEKRIIFQKVFNLPESVNLEYI